MVVLSFETADRRKCPIRRMIIHFLWHSGRSGCSLCQKSRHQRWISIVWIGGAGFVEPPDRDSGAYSPQSPPVQIRSRI